MIIGIGSDIIDVRRIEKSLGRFGDRFVQRLFTPDEQKLANGRALRAAAYAKRFAAKEACAKALGTGMNKSVFFHHMEVVTLPSGQPTLRLAGGALDRLKALTPEGHKSVIHLTISDEPPLAQALVIIEALPY